MNCQYLISLCFSYLKKCCSFIGEKAIWQEKGNQNILKGEKVLIVFKYVFRQSEQHKKQNKIDDVDESKQGHLDDFL